MLPVKSGWKTTEFYLHGGMQLLSFLVLIGFVNAGDQATLADSWAKAVAAVATLITSGFSFYSYIKSRTILKTNATGNVRDIMSPTSFHSNAAVLPIIALFLFAAPTFAQAPALRVADRPPIIETASSNVPAYFLPWRAWMHGQLNNSAPTPQQPQPIIINQPQPSVPAAPSTDPTVVALLQQQVQLHQQQVFLQQQIASLMNAGINHLAAPAAPAPAPAPIYYPVPQGVQPFPAAPPAPVQPLPIVAPNPPQIFPQAAPAPIQILPQAAPAPPQVIPITPPKTAPQTVPAPGPQSLPVMPPASAYRRITSIPGARLTHALCAPVP